MICSMIMVRPADTRVIMGLMHLGKGLGMRNCHPIQSNWDALDLTCLLGRLT
ncbi:hypothetical protein F383_31574 [Gossypium arboreum]|uniref:Uncharacterized protein n=1 Tax=Gossypium arboreum TaxID=29729 RepID=A0A0B0PGI7_GOSAR|nr:hypothetical protein F383_31574 [Gossypium arboreum]